ncbi:MAG: lipoprotein [Halioglobus sp.]|nr:lipoprotein [Halioglobus sp.]
MPRYIATVFITLALLFIGGCGQMGPLYMPSEAPPSTMPGDADVSGDASAVVDAD